MITIILNLINKAMEGILISELKEKKIIDGSEVIPVENKNKNYNINIYNLKNFINDIEITDYNLLFDTYENKVMDIIIKNCIFKNGKENVSDVSWHFVDNANCKFTITGNRFNYRFSFDSDVTKCNVLFTNNSHKEDNVFANATVMQFNNVKE